MSLTISNEAHGSTNVVKLGGSVEDDVLDRALEALRFISAGERLVIDLNELTLRSRGPFEQLVAASRRDHGDEIAIVCRRRSARRLLHIWGVDEAIPVYSSLPAALVDDGDDIPS